jgi:hypothetical protein
MKIPIPNADTIFFLAAFFLLMILTAYVFALSYNSYGKFPIDYNPFMNKSVFVKK